MIIFSLTKNNDALQQKVPSFSVLPEPLKSSSDSDSNSGEFQLGQFFQIQLNELMKAMAETLFHTFLAIFQRNNYGTILIILINKILKNMVNSY